MYKKIIFSFFVVGFCYGSSCTCNDNYNRPYGGNQLVQNQPSQYVGAPQVIGNTCNCVKTVVRPQLAQRVVEVPAMSKEVRTVVRPVVESFTYDKQVPTQAPSQIAVDSYTAPNINNYPANICPSSLPDFPMVDISIGGPEFLEAIQRPVPFQSESQWPGAQSVEVSVPEIMTAPRCSVPITPSPCSSAISPCNSFQNIPPPSCNSVPTSYNPVPCITPPSAPFNPLLCIASLPSIPTPAPYYPLPPISPSPCNSNPAPFAYPASLPCITPAPAPLPCPAPPPCSYTLPTVNQVPCPYPAQAPFNPSPNPCPYEQLFASSSPTPSLNVVETPRQCNYPTLPGPAPCTAPLPSIPYNLPLPNYETSWPTPALGTNNFESSARVIADTCQCVKTVVRPQLNQRIVDVPAVRQEVQTTVRPVVEQINYERPPVPCPYSSPLYSSQVSSAALGPNQVSSSAALGSYLPSERVISDSCNCVKTVVRPQLNQRLVDVPEIRKEVRTSVRPVLETINYEKAPQPAVQWASASAVGPAASSLRQYSNIPCPRPVQSCY